MNTTDIEVYFDSTPQLWLAIRKGQCGCAECKAPVGQGKTPVYAVEDLLETEESRFLEITSDDTRTRD